jgi:dsDNA-specific endonuclease/ATPase MutS2
VPVAPPPSVIDLHLSALLGEGETLPREEALPLQLRVLRHALEEAIAAGSGRIIVVHGLGRGVLRGAVHEVLRRTPGVARFSDDWHPRYGFGATEVWFA